MGGLCDGYGARCERRSLLQCAPLSSGERTSASADHATGTERDHGRHACVAVPVDGGTASRPVEDRVATLQGVCSWLPATCRRAEQDGARGSGRQDACADGACGAWLLTHGALQLHPVTTPSDEHERTGESARRGVPRPRRPCQCGGDGVDDDLGQVEDTVGPRQEDGHVRPDQPAAVVAKRPERGRSRPVGAQGGRRRVLPA